MTIAGAKALIESSLPAHQHPVAKQLLIAVEKHGHVHIPGYAEREVARSMVAAGILTENAEGFWLADGARDVTL